MAGATSDCKWGNGEIGGLGPGKREIPHAAGRVSLWWSRRTGTLGARMTKGGSFDFATGKRVTNSRGGS